MSVPISTTFSLTRLGDDAGQLQVLLSGFLRDTADVSHKLYAHIEADALHQVAAVVHFVRGAAFYMQAASLCEVGHRLELAALHNDRATTHELLGEFLALLAPLREFLHSHLQQLSAGHDDDSCLSR